MKVTDLIKYLTADHCPKEATVRVAMQPSQFIIGEEYPGPQVVWWSDDRQTVYLGML